MIKCITFLWIVFDRLFVYGLKDTYVPVIFIYASVYTYVLYIHIMYLFNLLLYIALYNLFITMKLEINYLISYVYFDNIVHNLIHTLRWYIQLSEYVFV